MPTLDTLGNIEMKIYFNDTMRHKRPHIHAVGPDRDAVLAIPDFDVIECNLRGNELRDVQDWLAGNRERVIAEWNRCNPQATI